MAVIETKSNSYTHAHDKHGYLERCSEAVDLLHYDRWPTGYGLCPHEDDAWGCPKIVWVN